MSTQFGLLTFPRGPTNTILGYGIEAETLGFDSAWLVDGISYQPADHETWALLGALARETSHVRIGTLVSAISLRHPVVLAAQAIAVDHLSGGRLELGIGAGDGRSGAAVGAPDWASRERVDRLAEQLAVLDVALRGDSVDQDGPYYPTQGVRLPAPIQRPRPPLVIAAEGPRTLALVARFGDVWSSLGGQDQSASGRPRVGIEVAVQRARRQLLTLEEHCQQIGRDVMGIRRLVLALRAEPTPLSSVDAFDEFVGRYSAAGFDEFAFYWPPIDNLKRGEPVSSEQRMMLERIAAERIASMKARPIQTARG